MTRQSRLRVVFFGSPGEAVATLRALVRAGHDVACAVTQPDRPAGRSKVPQPTAAKQAALALGIRVETPRSLRRPDVQRQLAELNADAFVVAAYGRFLPAEVLAMPRLGVLNVHPSQLPRHRGPSPVATAILEGDAETGVTVMLLDEGMDTGPILAQSAPVKIEKTHTTGRLTAQLFDLGADLLVNSLARYADGILTPHPQDERAATVTRLLAREDGAIDWTQPAEAIERKIRAFDPWPGTFTTWQGKNLKILRGDVEPAQGEVPGAVMLTPERSIHITTGAGVLAVTELQLEGKRAVSAADFTRGYPQFDGARLPS